MTARAGRRPIRARWIGLGAVLLLILGSIRLLDRPAPIFYYRVVDDRTLALGLVSGPGTWTRLTVSEEGAETVRLEVSSLSAPLPGTGGDEIEVTIKLRDPIGAKAVIDLSSGLEVPRTRCVPPAYLAPGCT
ncbi:MAG: hypothetical protein QOF73_3530 [Thermomicrobiales bacterium]|jgi:hypothetical protein|nr:hypothetical protein [Thermomicrobiales bacterium]